MGSAQSRKRALKRELCGPKRRTMRSKHMKRRTKDRKRKNKTNRRTNRRRTNRRRTNRRKLKGRKQRGGGSGYGFSDANTEHFRGGGHPVTSYDTC